MELEDAASFFSRVSEFPEFLCYRTCSLNMLPIDNEIQFK